MILMKTLHLSIGIYTIIYLIRLYLYMNKKDDDKKSVQLLKRKIDISIVLIIITVILSIVIYLIG